MIFKEELRVLLRENHPRRSTRTERSSPALRSRRSGRPRLSRRPRGSWGAQRPEPTSAWWKWPPRSPAEAPRPAAGSSRLKPADWCSLWPTPPCCHWVEARSGTRQAPVQLFKLLKAPHRTPMEDSERWREGRGGLTEAWLCCVQVMCGNWKKVKDRASEMKWRMTKSWMRCLNLLDIFLLSLQVCSPNIQRKFWYIYI